MKNKTTAAVLAFLLGGFAADQFYLNEHPKRLWWLLLPTDQRHGLKARTELYFPPAADRVARSPLQHGSQLNKRHKTAGKLCKSGNRSA